MCLYVLVGVTVTVLLRECHQLELLDVTGCILVGNASLRVAIDVADHPRRALTVCLGGTSVDVQDLVLPVDLPSNLTVDLSTPYNMLADLQLGTVTKREMLTLIAQYK